MNESDEPKCYWDINLEEIICPKHGKTILECPLKNTIVGMNYSASSLFFRLYGNELMEDGP